MSIGISSWLLGAGKVDGLIFLPTGEEGTDLSRILGPNRELTVLTTLSLSSRSLGIVYVDINVLIGILAVFRFDSFLGALGVYGRELGGSLSIP
jgi:hypothetical protein